MNTLLAFIIASLGIALAQVAVATEDAAEAASAANTATVIVYRKDDSVRSRGIKFGVRAEQRNQESIGACEALVMAREAGTFILSSSLHDTPSLELTI